MVRRQLETFNIETLFENEQLFDYLLQKLPLNIFLNQDNRTIKIGQREYTLYITHKEGFPRDAIKLKYYNYSFTDLQSKHEYGQLILPEVTFYDPKIESLLFGDSSPPILKRVILTRKVHPVEIELNKEYEGYSSQTRTQRFSTLQDLQARARYVARKYFPGFKLIL